MKKKSRESRDMIEFQLWIRMIRHHPDANNHVKVDHTIRRSRNISGEESGICRNLLEREPHGDRSEHHATLSVTVTVIVSEIEIQQWGGINEKSQWVTDRRFHCATLAGTLVVTIIVKIIIDCVVVHILKGKQKVSFGLSAMKLSSGGVVGSRRFLRRVKSPKPNSLCWFFFFSSVLFFMGLW